MGAHCGKIRRAHPQEHPADASEQLDYDWPRGKSIEAQGLPNRSTRSKRRSGEPVCLTVASDATFSKTKGAGG